MIITTFNKEHLAAAQELALLNYAEERSAVQALPEITAIPDLTGFADNGLGAAALEDGRLMGFVGCFKPWDGAFDSNARGTFTPVHAHGCVREHRAKIYEKMYQYMADRLVAQGVLYHAIALYNHDYEAIGSYFHNGFGHRCSDAIRKLQTIPVQIPDGIHFAEIPSEEAWRIRPLRKALSDHMGESCCFMYSSDGEFEAWAAKREKNGSRIFVAQKDGELIAFLEIAREGETFITKREDMQNIRGAYCRPEYRGQQIMQRLIEWTGNIIYKEGFQYLGVDYESFNLTAYHFWPKMFEPYTCSVTRRIDEGILKKVRD